MITWFDTSIVVSLDVAAALVAFASKDETRLSTGIGVDKGSLCATDGHRAIAFEPNATYTQGPWQGRRWTRAQVETAIKVAKAQKSPEIRLELEQAPAQTFAPIWRVVPDYGLEIPKRTTAIGIDPALIADLGKVAKACDCKGVQLTQAKSDLDPIGFQVQGPAHSARVVVMPMRI